MGRQIIKQPNGLYAIWSTIVDDFIITDATAEEYILFRIKEESDRVKKDITEIITKLDNCEKLGYYDLTWETALLEIKKRYGEGKLQELLESLS